MHHLSDYDYELPVDRIAQTPAAQRDASRLLVMERAGGRLRDKRFFQLAEDLAAGDLLVFNDTRVVPARLLGRRATGGCVEILLLGPASKRCHRPARFTYQALIKPLGRLKEGEKIFLDKGLVCRLLDPKNRIVDFDGRPAEDVMKKAGVLPLPPYVRRPPQKEDQTRYQTIFARHPGAVAAPTAGLHFTRRLLEVLRTKGVGTAFLTLHVGYGTFSPVRSDDIRRHQVHEEDFYIPAAAVKAIRRLKEGRRGRVIAVGTTVVRALEDAASEILQGDRAVDIRRSSRLFIYPPYAFRVVDGLITNFHLPRTSLLMLVAAFGGQRSILEAYRHAIEHSYRFYSYGDAMLIV
ncbi:tRNA preQ1(34) S-adenosylmethionine ribosyltransferase-isomerase QueA [Candidatus Velamenicoccus archaeovorus]|uniref:S-adenosylmethionine:tRNA ribosyltransferase-isomerase n=1 Tax=Velamenicoccus archaeovorus TaxID=1930593 RepID=A0A410P2S2_VELA1|nr:tRNA preQ1(34) S-adenosylmethionine ribosyltransferase-isomerase QueA [Candidatus Velamenicoccus archaeovorus]QAT16446.1 tRNA preQ1(34) S-adenosylmethionine ribosyltransferase-isomerase QueA [Candidatus Velamenicoccus archaeovorus]